jgi:replicative DNA helicase
MNERLPPCNIEAEMAVLGSIMTDAVFSMPKAARMLVPHDFYKGAHEKIYLAITESFTKKGVADTITVMDALEAQGALEDIGGVYYLTQLVNCVPSAARIEHYAEIVRTKSRLRRVSEISAVAEQAIYEGADNPEVVANQAIGDMMGLFRNGVHKPMVLGDILQETIKVMDEGQLKGIPTGFHNIDQHLGGLVNSDYIVIAGRPSMGKTSLAINIATNVAVNEQIPVGIISYEMKNIRLGERFIKQLAGLSPGQQTKISECPIYINDSSGRSVVKLVSDMYELFHEFGCRVFVVDYLQLIHADGKTRNDELTNISATIKDTIKELDVPLLLLSQLSRAVDYRQDKRPIMADLRDSGSIEQDADVIMFVYRDCMYDKKADPTHAELIFRKFRNGSARATAHLNFYEERTLFTDRDTTHQEPPENGKARKAFNDTSKMMGERDEFGPEERLF